MNKIRLSNLAHTWILDLDGTLVKHNGYLTDGSDTLLDGARDFLDKIPGTDMIILLTARKEDYQESTIRFLEENHIRYDKIIFNVPCGERILVNDRKPSGLACAVALNPERDRFENDFEIDFSL